eukprot:6181793-Pleurochrysis_carterae.AAC.1
MGNSGGGLPPVGCEEVLDSPESPVPRVTLKFCRPPLACIGTSVASNRAAQQPDHQLTKLRKELNASRVEASSLRKELAAHHASTRRLVKKITGASKNALYTADQAVQALSRMKQQLHYERSARHRLQAEVGELQAKLAEAKQTAESAGQRAKAAEEKAGKLEVSCAKAANLVEAANSSYRKRALHSQENKTLVKQKAKAEASYKAAGDECAKLRRQLEEAEKELAAAEEIIVSK